MTHQDQAARALCELCQAEPAESFSWFEDVDRMNEPSGLWRFAGSCTSESENYSILIRDLDSSDAAERWIRHLREKVWFSEPDFVAMLKRFETARHE